MDHAEAAGRITDWVAGRLDPATAAAVAGHVAGCDACRAVAAVARGVTAEVAEHGEHLFSAHPAPEVLARLALEPDALELSELATLRGHLAACPRCEHELALVRAAGAPAPLRTLRAWLPAGPEAMRLLSPALALVVAVLAVPAWLGIVELPRARERARTAERRIAERPSAPTPAPTEAAAPWGGGVDALILSGPTRGAAAPAPAVRVRPGQPAVPLLIDAARPAADPLTLRVLDAGGAVAWTLTAPRDRVWDAAHRLVSLLVPATALTEGEHRIEIAPAAGGPALFSARFRVIRAAD